MKTHYRSQKPVKLPLPILSLQLVRENQISAERLLSLWLAERKTRPDGWFTEAELQVVVNQTCQFVVHLSAPQCPKQALAIYTILKPLTVHDTKLPCPDLARQLAYQIVQRKSIVRDGGLVSPWVRSLNHEWTIQQVLSTEVVDSTLPLAVQIYKVKTLVLTGTAAGCVVEKQFAKRVLVFLSPKLGFGKRPNERHGDRMPPKHPRLLDAADIIGLVWYAMLQPGNEYPPRYFELRCTPSMIKHNREIIKDRRSKSNGPATRW